jgi:hypothetical protein
MKRWSFLLAPSILIAAIFLLTIWPSCNTGTENGNGGDTIKPTAIAVPSFDSDSAYTFVEAQVAFGPRVPGTLSHQACSNWLERKLVAYTRGHAIVQRSKAKLFTGEPIEIRNIIASFNPDVKRRILLCAHWDTRMFADYDTERRDEPIPGANDGGSGVAVLLEVARQLSANPLKNLGVDIVLFDAEDQGFPENMPQYKRPENTNLTWCLGSQHWSRNRHRMDYTYVFGILLDMVGAEGATFPREGNSVYYASHVVDQVWKEAASLGHGEYFVKAYSPEILDDHYFVNTVASIPTIDIVQVNPDNNKFHPSWHTHRDDLSVISKTTLQAVGETLLSVIYKEAAGSVAL